MYPQYCVANGTLVALDNLHNWGHQTASNAYWLTNGAANDAYWLANGAVNNAQWFTNGAVNFATDLTLSGINTGANWALAGINTTASLATLGVNTAASLTAAGVTLGAHGVRNTVGFARGATEAAGHLALNAATLSRPIDGHHTTDHLTRHFSHRM